MNKGSVHVDCVKLRTFKVLPVLPSVITLVMLYFTIYVHVELEETNTIIQQDYSQLIVKFQRNVLNNLLQCHI